MFSNWWEKCSTGFDPVLPEYLNKTGAEAEVKLLASALWFPSWQSPDRSLPRLRGFQRNRTEELNPMVMFGGQPQTCWFLSEDPYGKVQSIKRNQGLNNCKNKGSFVNTASSLELVSLFINSHHCEILQIYNQTRL